VYTDRAIPPVFRIVEGVPWEIALIGWAGGFEPANVILKGAF
jgi:hypothetical protein